MLENLFLHFTTPMVKELYLVTICGITVIFFYTIVKYDLKTQAREEQK